MIVASIENITVAKDSRAQKDLRERRAILFHASKLLHTIASVTYAAELFDKSPGADILPNPVESVYASSLEKLAKTPHPDEPRVRSTVPYLFTKAKALFTDIHPGDIHEVVMNARPRVATAGISTTSIDAATAAIDEITDGVRPANISGLSLRFEGEQYQDTIDKYVDGLRQAYKYTSINHKRF